MKKRTSARLGAVFFFCAALLFGIRTAFALDASSTNFFVRQEIGSTAGFSSSTTFRILQNGFSDAPGLSTSTTFRAVAGFLRALFQPVKPDYTQTGFHFRNDNGSESAATSATGGVENAALTNFAKATTTRIRVGISNEGGTIKGYSTQQFRLEYGFLVTTCSAVSNWVDVGTNADWSMVNTANLTDGANTTNISVGSGGVTDSNYAFLAANGGVKDAGSQAAAVSLPSDSFLELEYAVQANAQATSSATYCFRVTNAGSAANFTYSQYPQVTLSSGAGSPTITLTLSSSTVALGSFTPGTAVTATTTASVTISGGTNGYSLKINRTSVTSTLASSTITFPDYTAWNPGSGCTAGQGNGSTAPGAVFSFRVRQTGTDSSYCGIWWGTNDTNGTAIFAGMPTSSQTIANATSSNSGTTVTTVQYRADAPATQQATNYAGTVTFTAITNP